MSFYEGIVDIYYLNDWDLDDAWSRGVRVVLHRTSRGTARIDHEQALYNQRKIAALRKGCLWGGYHFLTAESIDEQLDVFMSVEDASNPLVAMAIDFEDNPNSGGTVDVAGVRTMVQKFNDAMKLKGYPDRYPMLYGGNKIREALNDKPRDPLLAHCPLWYVCYNRAAADGRVDQTGPLLPWPTHTWPNYTLWQYDDEHHRHGAPPVSMIHAGEDPQNILPGADWNRFKGSLDQLKQQWPFKGPSVVR
jgi:lysozyme